MIRNLLYSLFIHFILFLLIYAGFKFQKIQETKTSEIAISLVELDKNGNTVALAKKDEPPIVEDIKQLPPEPEKPKEIKKPEINNPKPAPKKIEPKKKPIIPPTKPEEKPLDKLVDKIVEQVEETPKEIPTEKPKDEPKPRKYYINGGATEITKTLELAGLSTREKFNLQSQIRSCYRRALKKSGLQSNVTLFITINVRKDGYVETNIDEVIDQKLYKDASFPSYKIAVDNAKLTIEICNPLRNLPNAKYDVWKQITFEFTEKETAKNN